MLTKPAAVRNNHELLEWLRIERVIWVVCRHGYPSNIVAGNKEDITMVLSGHSCRLEGLNVVQGWCVLIIHDLATLSTWGLFFKINGFPS